MINSWFVPVAFSCENTTNDKFGTTLCETMDCLQPGLQSKQCYVCPDCWQKRRDCLYFGIARVQFVSENRIPNRLVPTFVHLHIPMFLANEHGTVPYNSSLHCSFGPFGRLVCKDCLYVSVAVVPFGVGSLCEKKQQPTIEKRDAAAAKATIRLTVHYVW